MELFHQQELLSLLEAQERVCLSLYMPANRVEAQSQQNPIRFKNLLKTAEERLAGYGMRGPETAAMLKPAYDLLADDIFWRHQRDGLAVFASGDIFRYYRLPIPFKEVVVVNEHFHVKPLLPLFTENGPYFVLCLSQDDVRLYQGNHYSLTEVEVEGMPRRIGDVLWVDDQEQEYRFRMDTAPGGPRGTQKNAFHGHGGGPEDVSHQANDELLRFFRRINDAIREVLRGEKAPLVLAGVESHLPIYREVNTYPNLVEDRMITGSPEGRSVQSLQAEAWHIVQPIHEQARKTLADRFEEQRGEGTGLASSNLEVIVPAAYYGRVDTLFVATGHEEWGRFDPDQNVVHLHDAPEPGDHDLLNLVAACTLRNGGTVFAVAPEDVPGGEHMAALFRYRAHVEVEVDYESKTGS